MLLIARPSGASGRELPQVVAERLADVGALEGELDRRLEEAEAAPRVVAGAGESDGVDRLLGEETAQRVRELDLAPGAPLGMREQIEHARRQHVAADDAEVGGRLGRARLLDQVAHAPQAGAQEL